MGEAVQATTEVVAGIDIGGTKTKVIIADRAGRVLGSATATTPAGDGGDAMSGLAVALLREAEEAAGLAARAIGVGAAGVIDRCTGTVTAASASFSGWAGFGLAEALGSHTGLPVAVENDVNAFLLGETTYGAVAGQRDALGIALGTGVGGAIALDGAIFMGPRGAAGEIGHTPGYSDLACTCGQRGHLETVASGVSVAARYRALGGAGQRGAEGTGGEDLPVGAHTVAERARAGDALAGRAFAEAGEAVARAIATVANLIDIGHAVIGGGVRGAWDLLEPSLTATLAQNPPVSGYPLTVVPSALGGDSVALGAAAQAWARLDTSLDTSRNVSPAPGRGTQE